MRHITLIILITSFCLATICGVSVLGQESKSKPMRLGDLYDVLRLDLPQEPLDKRNRALVYAIQARGIDFELTDAIATDLAKEGASPELVGAIRKVSETNRLAKNREEARKQFLLFEACEKSDFNCKLTKIRKAIALDPTEKLYGDWHTIIEAQRPKTEASDQKVSTRGKKSNKILYSPGYINSTNNQILEKNFGFLEEFNSVFISRLKSSSLEVGLLSSLQKRESDQYFGAINIISKDENALRFLPYGVIVDLRIDSFVDLDEVLGLKAAETTGSISLRDTDSGKTIGFHSFDKVRGFGSTQDLARRNSMRDAATRVPDSFILEIVAKAR